MKDNPFASFAATSSKNDSGSGSGSGSGGDTGWMTTRKIGRDDTAIRKAKGNAAEVRKAKNRRGGGGGNKAAAGGKKGASRTRGVGGSRKKKKDFIDNSSDEESFVGYSEDEEDDDSFIADDDDDDDGGMIDSEEEEGDWDSGMEEDDDSDFGGKKKKKKKTTTTKKSKTTVSLSRSARAANRRAAGWKPSSSQNSMMEEEDDEIEESPIPPTKKSRGGRQKKKVVESPISLDSDEEMSDDDIYADSEKKKKKKSNKKDGLVAENMVDLSCDMSSSPSPHKTKQKANNKSKYFSNEKTEFGEEKKEEDEEEDENLLNGVSSKRRNNNNASKKRRILDDSESSSDDDGDWGGIDTMTRRSNDNAAAAATAGGGVDLLFDDNDLSDTPRKSTDNNLQRRQQQKQSFSPDDFADDDEANAIQAAMKASLKEEEQKHKRLKKKKTSGKKKGNKTSSRSSSSSLEQIKKASPAKEFPKYKDDIETLQDSDDNMHEEDEEDDEVEVYETTEVDEEEQTAAQVLNEANALSSKIIRIVSGWCGGLDKGNKVKGMILGDTVAEEGTLSLGGGGGGGGAGGIGGGGGGDKGDKNEANNDDMWITNETMQELLPNVKLAEYQLLGVNWMALLNRIRFGNGKSKNGKNGSGRKGGMNVNGILADEMGLGKTVQTIAFLAWLNHQNKGNNGTQQQRPHLIVVPASVLSNWMNEFKKFAPEMKVEKYHGNQAEREIIRDELDRNHIRGNEPLDAVLTTFSYFSSDSNRGDRSFLRKFEFDYLVVDEGHTLKNPKGLRYKNLNKFQTSHRLLLTGTPVQNSPKELMSLLCFLMPLFDSKTKSSKRKRGYDDDSDDENDGGERMLEYFVHLEGGTGNAEAYRKLKQLFAPFVLRRKKEDVLGQLLPPKTRKVDIVPMDEATQAAYNAILSSHIKARAEKASGTANAAAQKHLFTALRKAANHPLLLRNRFKGEEEKDTLARLALAYQWFGNDASCTLQLVRDELDNYSDYEVHCAALHMIEENPERRKHLEKYTLMEKDLFSSPKFVRLRALLPKLVGEGHRILIFSQWTKVMDLMGHLMQSLQMTYLRLDGSTAVSERQDLLDTFTNDSSIPVFLLSTRAGGMGLNLTSADVCILHDLDFNPFNDRQAEDRCHRIGQKKPVTVIKMVTQGTVDEDIYSIQERKARMNEAIMEEGSGKKKKSSDNEEMCGLANAAVERFLKSPVRTATSSTRSAATESGEGAIAEAGTKSGEAKTDTAKEDKTEEDGVKADTAKTDAAKADLAKANPGSSGEKKQTAGIDSSDSEDSENYLAEMRKRLAEKNKMKMAKEQETIEID